MNAASAAAAGVNRAAPSNAISAAANSGHPSSTHNPSGTIARGITVTPNPARTAAAQPANDGLVKTPVHGTCAPSSAPVARPRYTQGAGDSTNGTGLRAAPNATSCAPAQTRSSPHSRCAPA